MPVPPSARDAQGPDLPPYAGRTRRELPGGFVLIGVRGAGTISWPQPQALRWAGQTGYELKELGHVSIWEK